MPKCLNLNFCFLRAQLNRGRLYDSFCEAFYCRGDIAAGRTAKSAINAKLNICRLAFKIVEKVSL